MKPTSNDKRRRERWRRIRAAWLVVAWLSASLFSLTAQTVDEPPKITPESLHQWGAVTLFHGLPSDRVHAITQDQDGMMWFGTDAGLARYDGRRTQTVTDPALPAGRIQALQMDETGAIWVGTDGGAARLQDGQFQSIKETEGKSITAVITPSPGRVLLASVDGLVFDVAVQNGNWTVRQVPATSLRTAEAEKPAPSAFTSLAVTGESVLTGSESRGLIAISGAEAHELTPRPHANVVEALERDAAGRLWMGTKGAGADGGLFDATDPQHPIHIEGVTGTVVALRAGANGALWAGTDGSGVYQLQGSNVVKHFTFDGTAGGLRSNHVYSIFVDREQVVWFGTDRGVCRFDPQAWQVESVSPNPESSFVRAIYRAPDGRLWCGTGRGLFVQEPGQTGWRAIPELAQKTIYAVTRDGNGRLLAGTASGLYAADAGPGGAVVFKRLPVGESQSDGSNSVRAITQFQGKTYIAVFGRGIELVEGDRTTQFWPTGDTEPRAREAISLFAGADQRLWVGTAAGGVYLFDGTNLVRDPALTGLESAAVRSIDGTPGGLFWMATARGLFALRDGTLFRVPLDADTRVVMVAGDPAASREVWCATAGSGLIKVSFDAATGPIAVTFDAEQGLPSPNVYALARDRADTTREAIVIGTNRGLAHYQPGTVAPLVAPSRVISKRIHSLDEVRNGLWLEYPQNSLLVDIAAASSRTFPEQFQYVFTLYDAAGKLLKRKFSRESQFSMEALPAGTYRMQAIAYSADLVPSKPFEFTFNVPKAPFPWTVAALSLLLLLALFALLWANFEHHRIARTSGELALANQELADARLRLANEAESERRRIARDLHDQTLADLRRLMLMTDHLPAGNGGKGAIGSAAVRQEIESVSNEIRRICEDLSPSVLENVGFAAALEFALTDAVTHLPEKDKFSFDFNCADDLEDRLRLAPSVKMQIYRIAQEAISNVCRHAQARHVRFDVILDSEGALTLTLQDDGKGMAAKQPAGEPVGRRGRGLANIRARASLVEAEADWIERESGGTAFILRKSGAA